MRFSLQKFLTAFGVSILVAIIVSVVTYRASETGDKVALEFPGALALQVGNESETSSLTFILTQAGSTWFLLPGQLVITDEPLRLMAHDLVNGILTDAVRNEFSALLQYDDVDVWQLDTNALAAFVEVVGGYEVSGSLLSGAEAIAYLNLGTPGDAARFQKMWLHIVLNLDAGQLSEVLTNLGSTSRSNRSIEQLTSYFGSMQVTFQSGNANIREVAYTEGRVNGRMGLYLQEQSRRDIINSIEEGRK